MTEVEDPPVDPETGEPVSHTGGSTHYECRACELELPTGATYQSDVKRREDAMMKRNQIKTAALDSMKFVEGEVGALHYLKFHLEKIRKALEMI